MVCLHQGTRLILTEQVMNDLNLSPCRPPPVLGSAARSHRRNFIYEKPKRQSKHDRAHLLLPPRRNLLRRAVFQTTLRVFHNSHHVTKSYCAGAPVTPATIRKSSLFFQGNLLSTTTRTSLFSARQFIHQLARIAAHGERDRQADKEAVLNELKDLIDEMGWSFRRGRQRYHNNMHEHVN
jgi:hypothetical protein